MKFHWMCLPGRRFTRSYIVSVQKLGFLCYAKADGRFKPAGIVYYFEELNHVVQRRQGAKRPFMDGHYLKKSDPNINRQRQPGQKTNDIAAPVRVFGSHAMLVDATDSCPAVWTF